MVMIAPPAVLELLNTREVSTRSILALAAVLLLLNVIVAKEAMSEVMVALPAEDELLNVNDPPAP